MLSRLIRTTYLLAGIAAAPAFADPCADALGRFDYPAARDLARQRLNAAPDDAAAWICLARSQYETGLFVPALASLQRADPLPMDTRTRVLADNWFGVTLRRLDRRAEAWEWLQAALAMARKNGDRGGLATALHNTGLLLKDAGRPDDALAVYRESIAINPDQAEHSASLNNMGLIEAERGDPAQAAHFIEAAIALNRREGHFHHLGKHLMNLGNLYREQGRFDEAEALLKEGAVLVEKADDRFWIAVSHRLAGWLARDRGRIGEATEQLERAARDYALSGAPAEETATRSEIARLDVKTIVPWKSTGYNVTSP